MTAEKDRNKSGVLHNHSDFSIEHILNKAGTSATVDTNSYQDSQNNGELTDNPYSWLQCTRYCPPKISKSQKRLCPQKRQLGRHPRIPFTCYQLSVLERKFQQSPYLSSEEVITIAKQLQLADVRVKIWFQNRRARERREKLQNAYKDSDKKEKTTSVISANNSDVSSPVPQVHQFFSLHNVPQSIVTDYSVLIKRPDDVR